MKRLDWKIDDQVTLHGLTTPGDIAFTIVGTSGDLGPDNVVLVPLERLNQMQGNLGQVILFFVRIDRSEFAATVIRQIDDRFANSPAETETQTELGVAQHQVRDLRILFVGVKLIAVIVVMVIVMVAANTAAMAVRERRHELAVMRSIGFTRAALVTLLIVEGLMMGAAAGAARMRNRIRCPENRRIESVGSRIGRVPDAAGCGREHGSCGGHRTFQRGDSRITRDPARY